MSNTRNFRKLLNSGAITDNKAKRLLHRLRSTNFDSPKPVDKYDAAQLKRAMRRSRNVMNLAVQAECLLETERLYGIAMELASKRFLSDHSYPSPMKKLFNPFRRSPMPTRGFFGRG